MNGSHAVAMVAEPANRRPAWLLKFLRTIRLELPDCRHDAPLSHPDLFRTAIVDPLLEAVGVPYTNAA